MALLTHDGATNQQITAYELRSGGTSPRFMINQLRLAEHWLRSTASTATIPILDSGEVARLPVAVPPLAEQEEIVTYIDEATSPLRAVVDRARSEVSLLREFQTRLMANVVTGKLDVREAAAQLPEEHLEPVKDSGAESEEAEAGDADGPETEETSE
jgi:type I restriction enzyme S subunit